MLRSYPHTPLEIVFQEQSYSSLHSGQSTAWDRFRGIIANPGALSPIPVVLSLIPAAIRDSAGADANLCKTHETS